MLTRKIAATACAGWLALAGVNGTACAGETAVYVKSGYFTWNEKIDGAYFVKEGGMTSAVGISRQDTVPCNVTLGETVELWGGELHYDGHDVTNTTTMVTDTSYIGTREEFSAGVNVPHGGPVTLGPVAGMGHRFWIRSRSGEDWNTIYGKAGAAVQYASGGFRFFTSGGVNIPFFTRSHVNLRAAGYEDVVTEPKSRPAIFFEAGIRRYAWDICIDYEEMKFGQSEKVAARPAARLQNGVAVLNSQAFQPDSSSSLIAFKVRYSF